MGSRPPRFRAPFIGPVLAALLLSFLSETFLLAVESPYTRAGPVAPKNNIDRLLFADLAARNIQPAPLCSDAVFLRRVTLDMTGTLPDPRLVMPFLASRDPRKRQGAIEALFEREAWADNGSLKWCDILRVKAEFPINLWPNAVQAYHRWIQDALKTNMPYDRFARQLLTSSGSNFRVPPVNFYRALQGKSPEALAGAAALTFLGMRYDTLTPHMQQGLSACFSRVAFKGTAEWKEEIVYLDPAPAEESSALMPDGTQLLLPVDKDPRLVFCEWLTADDNPWFAKVIVNRIWSWLFGRGLVHPADDWRVDNPPLHPKVLAYLAEELIAHRYDLRHIYRLILNSHTYQQSSIPRTGQPSAPFARYPVRRLDAEVLIDALCWISGTRESYSSMIPEPFTWIPGEHRSIELSDGSITSHFLEMFGRPPRDTGYESERSIAPSKAQRLHLLNSSSIQKRITNSKRLRKLMRGVKGKPVPMIQALYLMILSRPVCPEEIARAEAYFKEFGLKQGAADLAWALLNSKEFLYRH